MAADDNADKASIARSPRALKGVFIGISTVHYQMMGEAARRPPYRLENSRLVLAIHS